MLGVVVDLAASELDRLHKRVSYRFARAQPRAGSGGSHGAAARGPRVKSAAAPSRLCGRPGKAARSRTSVQPPPPCQIRRSVTAGLTVTVTGTVHES
jgi:hypothetical protein